MPIKGIDQIQQKINTKLSTLGTKFIIRGKGTCYGFFASINKNKVSQTLIDQVDTSVVVDSNIKIEVDDFLLYEGTKYKVIDVTPVRPDGTLLLYELLMRS